MNASRVATIKSCANFTLMGQSSSREQHPSNSPSSQSSPPSPEHPSKPVSLPLDLTSSYNCTEEEPLHVFEASETRKQSSSQLLGTTQARRRRCNVTNSPSTNYSRSSIDFEEVTNNILEPSAGNTRFRWHYWKTQAWRPRNSPEQNLQLHSPICCLGVCCCCRGDVFTRRHFSYATLGCTGSSMLHHFSLATLGCTGSSMLHPLALLH